MSTNPRTALHSIDARPKQSLGQNFLCDPNILFKIADAAKLTPDDTVIEVGAGTGALTEYLVKTGCRLHVIEIDQRFEPLLSDLLVDHSNATLPRYCPESKGAPWLWGTCPTWFRAN